MLLNHQKPQDACHGQLDTGQGQHQGHQNHGQGQIQGQGQTNPIQEKLVKMM